MKHQLALSSPKGWLLLIVIIAAFLRLWNITTVPPGLYPDEAMNGNNALEVLATGDSKVFYPENNGREGLFINIQSVFLALFGNEPWALRLPSALFGILTVLGVYFLTRELFNTGLSDNPNINAGNLRLSDNHKLIRSEYIALLAAFLLATSFWHINFSRIGFRAIMAPAFLTWGVYLLLLAFNKITANFRTSDVPNITSMSGHRMSRNLLLFLPVLAGLVYGLGMHSYIAFRATPLLILFIITIYLFKNKDREIRRRIFLVSCLFSLVAFVVFLPLGLHFLNNPADFFGRTTELSVFNSPTPLKDLTLNTIKTLGMFNFSGDYNWRHNISGQPQLFWPVGIMFLVGLLIAIRYLIHNTEYQILLAWLGVAALPVVISNEGIPHALRAIIIIPPVFILAGIGGTAIYNFFNSRTSDVPNLRLSDNHRLQKSRNLLLKIASFILLLYILLTAYFTYFIRWAKNQNTADAFASNYVEIGRQLNSLPVEQSKFVIVNAGGVDVRGIPMPSQTVMFITDTFTPAKQKQKNIRYLLPDQAEKANIPESTVVVYLK